MPLMPWDKISWKLMFTVLIATLAIMILIKLVSRLF